MIGHVYLLPCYLSDSNDRAHIAPVVSSVIKNTTYYLVENVRTARRFISSLQLGVEIDSLQFEVMDKNFDPAALPHIFDPVVNGKADLAILSEAGLPGIADPGKYAVAYAHQQGVPVHPLPGSSSILLALIASGLNGQQFSFHGYLPIEKQERKKKLKELESTLNATGYTQLFMETPYRNNQLLTDVFLTLNPSTFLFIGSDITGEKEKCITKQIGSWKKNPPDLHKIPTVFGLGKS